MRLTPLVFVALLFAVASATNYTCEPKPLYGITYAPLALDLYDICLPVEQVEKDMEIIAGLAYSVRIYNIAVCYENAIAIMESAKKYGMTVLMGLWLEENNTAIFESEFAVFPEFMEKYEDIIEAVIVGNEPRFIEEIDFPTVNSSFHRVKDYLMSNGYPHEVSIAEVWPILESSEGLEFVEHLDFIAMNMQPYWEGFHAICPENETYCVPAGEYIHLKAEGLAEYFGKKLVISEAGWPTNGEACCSGERDNAQSDYKAVPSIPNASAFVNNFVDHARNRSVMYYIHASFDEIWKQIWDPCDECKGQQVSKFSADECNGCVVDYNWGIYNEDREHKSGYDLPESIPQCSFTQFP